MEANRNVPIDIETIEVATKNCTEIRKVLNFFSTQKIGLKRRKFTKSDLDDIEKGKTYSDFEFEMKPMELTQTKLLRPRERLERGSTSKSMSPAPGPSTSKFSQVLSEKQKPCPYCQSRRFRVVDPGRADGKRIIECARRSCLASICFTTLPEGETIGDPPDEEELGWYAQDPVQMFYPTEIFRGPQTYRKGDKSKDKIEEPIGSLFIPCPGQKKLVQVL